MSATTDQYNIPYTLTPKWTNVSMKIYLSDSYYEDYLPAKAFRDRSMSNILYLLVMLYPNFNRSAFLRFVDLCRRYSLLFGSPPPERDEWLDASLMQSAFRTWLLKEQHLDAIPMFGVLDWYANNARLYSANVVIGLDKRDNPRVQRFIFSEPPPRTVEVPVLEVKIQPKEEEPAQPPEVPPEGPTIPPEQVPLPSDDDDLFWLDEPEAQAIAVVMDQNADGQISTEEIEAVDTNNDNVITHEEVLENHEALGYETAEELEEKIEEVKEAIEEGKIVVEPVVDIPEEAPVPEVEEVLANPNYDHTETFYVNMLIHILSDLYDNPTVNIAEFVKKTHGTLPEGYIPINNYSAGVQAMIDNLTSNGQLKLNKEDYTGTDPPMCNEEEYDTLIQALNDVETDFTEQQRLMNELTRDLSYLDATLIVNGIHSHNPRVLSFDERLRSIERSYVRL